MSRPRQKYEDLRERGPRLVAIGGGTGLAVLLRGLKRYTRNLTAVVTVSDDGGSSGRLRGELGVLPPGDIRNCLVAMAETETLMDRVFQHRFQAGDGLKGHSLGNLLLVAMEEITGDLVSAIKEVSKVLAVRGRVLPATLQQVVLAAELRNGVLMTGETAIRQAEEGIHRVFLLPPDCRPLDETLEAIAAAEAVILGPGSLYTSLIPNLLVRGVAEALRCSPAPKIYVANIMTEKGETDGHTLSDHLAAIDAHVGPGLVDYVLVHRGALPQALLDRYRAEGAEPVAVDAAALQARGEAVVMRRLARRDDVAWHDPELLARTVMRLVRRRGGAEGGARRELLP